MDDGDLTVVGEATDGEEALEVWRQLDPPPVPDVVVLDNRMPKLTGLEVAEEMLGQLPEQIVVLYSAFLDDTVRAEAKRIGIAACLSKGDIRELPATIKRLAQSA
jgi:CheY-like chemotaxis protein